MLEINFLFLSLDNDDYERKKNDHDDIKHFNILCFDIINLM